MSNLTRYNPFDDLFADFGKGFFLKPFPLPAETEVKMKVDVKEDDKAYTVSAEIPGVRKEDIQLDVDGPYVSIRAEVKRDKEEKKDEKVVYSERSYGMASRSFRLPVEVDAQGAKAEYRDGMLNVVLPKKAGGAAKRITIA